MMSAHWCRASSEDVAWRVGSGGCNGAALLVSSRGESQTQNCGSSAKNCPGVRRKMTAHQAVCLPRCGEEHPSRAHVPGKKLSAALRDFETSHLVAVSLTTQSTHCHSPCPILPHRPLPDLRRTTRGGQKCGSVWGTANALQWSPMWQSPRNDTLEARGLYPAAPGRIGNAMGRQ